MSSLTSPPLSKSQSALSNFNKSFNVNKELIAKLTNSRTSIKDLQESLNNLLVTNEIDLDKVKIPAADRNSIISCALALIVNPDHTKQLIDGASAQKDSGKVSLSDLVMKQSDETSSRSPSIATGSGSGSGSGSASGDSTFSIQKPEENANSATFKPAAKANHDKPTVEQIMKGMPGSRNLSFDHKVNYFRDHFSRGEDFTNLLTLADNFKNNAFERGQLNQLYKTLVTNINYKFNKNFDYDIKREVSNENFEKIIFELQLALSKGSLLAENNGAQIDKIDKVFGVVEKLNAKYEKTSSDELGTDKKLMSTIKPSLNKGDVKGNEVDVKVNEVDVKGNEGDAEGSNSSDPNSQGTGSTTSRIKKRSTDASGSRETVETAGSSAATGAGQGGNDAAVNFDFNKLMKKIKESMNPNIPNNILGKYKNDIIRVVKNYDNKFLADQRSRLFNELEKPEHGDSHLFSSDTLYHTLRLKDPDVEMKKWDIAKLTSLTGNNPSSMMSNLFNMSFILKPEYIKECALLLDKIKSEGHEDLYAKHFDFDKVGELKFYTAQGYNEDKKTDGEKYPTVNINNFSLGGHDKSANKGNIFDLPSIHSHGSANDVYGYRNNKAAIFVLSTINELKNNEDIKQYIESDCENLFNFDSSKQDCWVLDSDILKEMGEAKITDLDKTKD